MIKRPVNFGLGIYCICCFVINVVKDRDMFLLIINAIAVATNITFGLCE